MTTKDGRPLLRKLGLGVRDVAALPLLVAFGVLALPLSLFSDEGRFIPHRTPKGGPQSAEPQGLGMRHRGDNPRRSLSRQR